MNYLPWSRQQHRCLLKSCTSGTAYLTKCFRLIHLLLPFAEACDRIAALTTERMSWEDWKKLQKENAAAAAKVADEEEAKMREYRAQLDADRNERLSKGTNNKHLRVQVMSWHFCKPT